MSDLEIIRAKNESKAHFGSLITQPTIDLAIELGRSNPLQSVDPYLERLLPAMIVKAHRDEQFPYFEGRVEVGGNEADYTEYVPQLHEDHPDFDALINGVRYMLAWGSKSYEEEYTSITQSPDTQSEALISVATMYRRDAFVQSINKFSLLDNQVQSLISSEAELAEYQDDEEMYEAMKSMYDIDKMRRAVEEAKEVITKSALDVFRFKDTNEVIEYFARFEQFLTHRDVQVLTEIQAKLLRKTEIERVTGYPIDEYQNHIDELPAAVVKTLNIVTLDYYRDQTRKSILNYTLLSRMIYGGEDEEFEGISLDDYKSITLAKLGIRHQLRSRDGSLIDGFPALTVPDEIDDDFMQSTLVTKSTVNQIRYNMLKHVGNLNLWFK